MNDRTEDSSPARLEGAPPRWGAAVAARSLLIALIGAVLAIWIGNSAALGVFAPLVSSLVLWMGLLAAVFWAVFVEGSGRFCVDLRFRFVAADLAIALLLGLALRSVAVLGEMVAGGLSSPQLPGLLLFDGVLSPMSWVMFIVAPVAIAPFVEEFFFRGVLQPAIGQAAGRRLHVGRRAASAIAVVCTAALFAGGHVMLNPSARPLLTFTLTLLVGLTCGALAAVTGRLGPAIGIHFMFNLSGVVLLILGTFA